MFIITTKQITVKFTEADAEKLSKLARENNLSVAEQIRKFVEKGIALDGYKNDEANILSNMQDALRKVLDPQIERMVKISVKNSIASSINLLHIAFLMRRMARDESHTKLEAVMDEARRLGILFVQQAKGSIDDFVRSSIEKIEETWEDVQ